MTTERDERLLWDKLALTGLVCGVWVSCVCCECLVCGVWVSRVCRLFASVCSVILCVHEGGYVGV